MYVLFIDDEPSIEQFIKPLMERKGYEVEVVATGEGGIVSVNQRRPDVLILDLGLPDIKGDSVLIEIRKTDPDLPVAILSGHTDQIIQDRLKQLGADEFFCKPVLLPELIEQIDKLYAAKGNPALSS